MELLLIRKTSVVYKRRRRQLHLKKIRTTTSNERREGPSYEHNIGLSLNPTATKSQKKTTSASSLQTLNEVNINTETIVNNGKTSLPNEALQQSTFLERRQEVVETYSGNLYLPNGSLKLTTIQKLADAGLAFSTLKEMYRKFGINGLYGILALAIDSELHASTNQVAENFIKQKNNFLSFKVFPRTLNSIFRLVSI